MSISHTDSLTGAVRMIEPALQDVLRRSGEGVRELRLWQDYARGEVMLQVSHGLISWSDIDRGHWQSLVGERIKRAVLSSPDPSADAKRARMERRQLQSRGMQARENKAHRR